MLITSFTLISCFYYAIIHVYTRRGGNPFKSIWLDYTNLTTYINRSILHNLKIKLLESASSMCDYHRVYHAEIFSDILYWLAGVVKLFGNIVALMSRPPLFMLFIFTLNFIYTLLILSIPFRLVFILFWLLRLLSYKLSTPITEVKPLEISDFTARWPLCMLTFRLWPDPRQSKVIPILDKYKLLNSSRSGLLENLEPWEIEEEIRDGELEVSEKDLNLMLDYWYLRTGNPDDWRKGSTRELLNLIFLIVIYEPYLQTFSMWYLLSMRLTKKQGTNQTTLNHILLTKGFFFLIHRFIFFVTSYPVKAIWISSKSVDKMLDLYRTDPNYKLNNIKKLYIYKDLDFFFCKLHTLISYEYIWKPRLKKLRIYRNETSIWNFNGKEGHKKIFVNFTKIIEKLEITTKSNVVLHRSSRTPHLCFNIDFVGTTTNNTLELIEQSNLSSLVQSTVKEPQFSTNKYTWLREGSFLIKSDGKIRSMYPFNMGSARLILSDHPLIEKESTEEYEKLFCEHFLINFLFSTNIDRSIELNYVKKEILNSYSEIIGYDINSLDFLSQKQIIAACYSNNYYPLYYESMNTPRFNSLFFALHNNYLPVLIALDRDLLNKLLHTIYSNELSRDNVFLKDLYYTLRFSYAGGSRDILKYICLKNGITENQLVVINESPPNTLSGDYTGICNFSNDGDITKTISSIFNP